MNLRDPYTKLVLVAGIFIFICAILAAAAFAATPAFTAHKNGTSQTIANDTDTLLTWSTEGFDTNSNFATNRFTPTVAGKYLIVVSVHCPQAGYCMPAIRKNGTTIIARAQVMERTVGQTPSVTAIVDMNGTSDYVEAMATSSGTVIAGTIERTYFSGSQIDGGGGSAAAAGSAGQIQFNQGGNLQADSALNWDNTTKQLGIGTASPEARIEIEGGRLRIDGNTSSGVLELENELGDINYVFTGANNDRNGALVLRTNNSKDILLEGGNVGIGTASPQRVLHVSDPVATIILEDEDNPPDLRKRFISVGATGSMTFGKFTDAYATTYHMAIMNDGKVGIGTTTPGEKLDVFSNASGVTTNIRNYNSSTGTSSAAAFTANTATSNAYAQLVQVEGAFPYAQLNFGAGNTGGGAILTWGANPLVFGTNGAEAMRISSAGNAGIGTTAPDSKLHVRSTVTGSSATEVARFSNTTGAERGLSVMAPSATSGHWVGLQVFNTQQDFSIANFAGTRTFTILDNGNVGIGTATPTESKLVIDPSASFAAGNGLTIRSGATTNEGGELELNDFGNGNSWAIDNYNTSLRFYRSSTEYFRFNTTNAYKIGGGSWASLSDRRLKDVKSEYRSGLEKVIALQPVVFRYKKDNPRQQPADQDFIGYIAQDVQPVFPEAVTKSADGYLALDPWAISVATVNAIKELADENKALRAELRATINSQDAELDLLRRQIEDLKAAR